MGTSDGIAGNGDERGLGLFYLFTFLPLKAFLLFGKRVCILFQNILSGWCLAELHLIGFRDNLQRLGEAVVR